MNKKSLFKKWLTLLLIPFFILISCSNSSHDKDHEKISKELYFNEICSKNRKSLTDSFGESPDWIELYNNTNKDINLINYSISNDSSNKEKFIINKEIIIKSKKYLLLMASGRNLITKDGEIHLPFELSQSKGETLYLYDFNRNLIDNVSFPPLKDDITFGVLNNEYKTLFPTPGEENTTEYVEREILPQPTFSMPSGFYEKDFNLTLSCDGKYDIHYTLDSSEPTTLSPKYENPILIYDKSKDDNILSKRTDICATHIPYIPKTPVNKCMVVKAKCFDNKGNYSGCVSKSYWIDTNKFIYEKVPVISISTDYDNLFDHEKGIYCNGKIFEDYKKSKDFDPTRYYTQMPANYKQRGYDWERIGDLTYLNKKRNVKCEQRIGIRLHGSASCGYSKKSFNLYSRYNYDKNNNFTYKFNEKKCDCISLRNGGNYEYFPINDVINSNMAEKSNLSFDTQNNSAVYLFLNGEYWGIYYINDKYNSKYFENKYKIDNPIIIKNGVVEEGRSDDINVYNDFLKLGNLDFKKDENYEKFRDLVDEESYIDYMIFQSYFGNNDYGINQNCLMWKDRLNVQYKKIRFSLFDTDYCGGVDSNPNSNPFTGNINWKFPCLKSLLQRDDFRTTFINRMNILVNIFSSNEIINIIDEIYNSNLKLIEQSNKRHLGDEYKNPINSLYSKKSNFFKNRNQYYYDFVKLLFPN